MTTGRPPGFLFVRNAWIAGTWPFTVFMLVSLVVDYAIKQARADEFAASWGVDQLPVDYWFSVIPILLVAQLIRLALRRLIRSPRLTLEDGMIRTSFTESSIKQVVADRVTEVQVDERRSLLRFFIPDGLSLAVRADLLESGASDPIDLARGFGNALDVPVVQVRRRVWGWRRTEVSTTPL